MTETKPTTGKYSYNKYKCQKCGREKIIGTNHWGETYQACNVGGCRPGPSVWHCLEPTPEGYTKPEPWKLVKLGDIAKIIRGGKII